MNSNQFGRQVPVPSFIPDEPVGDVMDSAKAQDTANTLPTVTTSPEQLPTPVVTPQPSYTPLLPDLSAYDLTVTDALLFFAQQGRKTPSDRTLQRYCQDGRFDCYKVKTTRNGNPVHEWIINGSTLLEFVNTKPELTASDVVATPGTIDVANTEGGNTNTVEKPTTDMTPPVSNDDANIKADLPRSSENKPSVTTSPTTSDDANIDRQSKMALLIENAEMTARLDAKNELICELREDKKFMREQIVHQRKNDSLMAEMHGQTLDALKAVSIAGRHTKVEMLSGNPDQPKDDFYDVRPAGNSSPNQSTDGV